MNIVIVNDFDYIEGGATKIAIETANLLSHNRKNKVFFFSGTDTDGISLDSKVIKVSTGELEAIKRKNKLFALLSNIYNINSRKKLSELLKTLDKKNTIIHYHTWTKILSSSVFDVAFKMGFHTVLTAHECFSVCPNGVFYNFMDNKVCDKKALSLNCFLCNCDSRNYLYKILRFLRSFVQQKIIKINNKIEYVICVSELNEKLIKPYFGTNVLFTRIFNPTDHQVVSASNNRKNYYLYVGRTEYSKGINMFCKSITELNLNGVVIGDGELFKQLTSKYTQIKFLGWQDSKTINKYLSEAKALIYPSLAYESFGLSIIDALSYNTPVFCSYVCGGSYLIQDGVNGFVFSDYFDLISKLKQFEKKPFSFEFNNDSYSKEVYLDSVEQLFNKIIQSDK